MVERALTVAEPQTQPSAGLPSHPPVLFLADHFGYPGGVSHGLTTYFLEVLPALVRAGVPLTACFLREPHPAAERLREHDIQPVFLSLGKGDLSAPFRVAALARKSGCRILHAAQMKATLAARVAAPLIGARTIVHLHDLTPMGPVMRGMHRFFARPSDTGLCVADAMHAFAVNEYALRADRVRTLHNSIDLSRFRHLPADTRQQLRSQLGIDDSSPVLALVGRMYPVKGHRTLLEMLPGIVRRQPRTVLLLVGDGPERPACEALVRELHLEGHVRFLGQRNDIPGLLLASDLLVVPSASEGLPIAAIEASACGRPVVGFDVGGLREVVKDGASGSVVPPGDSEAFTQAILSLIESPERLLRWGARAFEEADRFGIHEHVRGLLQCYDNDRSPAAHAVTAFQ